jgi:hypothetical protein
MVSPLHLAGAVLLVLGVASFCYLRPIQGLWLVLVLSAVHPIVAKLLQINLGVTGLALVVYSAWKEVALAAVLFAGLCSITLSYRAGRRWQFRPALMDVVAIALVALVAFGFVLRHDAMAINAVRLLLFPVGVYIAIRLSPISAGTYFKAMVIIAAGIAVFAVIQSSLLGFSFVATYWGIPTNPLPATFIAQGVDGPRASATFASPNELGFALVAWAFMACALLVLKPSRDRWVVLAISMILIGLSVTFSRSAIAAASVGMALIVLAVFRLSPGPRRALAYLTLAIVPAVLLSGAIYYSRGGADLLTSTISAVLPPSSSSLAPNPTPSASLAPNPTPSASLAPNPTPSASLAPNPTPSASLAPNPTPSASLAPSATPTVGKSDQSTISHLNSLEGGWSLLKANPLGTGLGTVGPRPLPGTSEFPEYIIESYYLAMGVSLGWLGFAWVCFLPVAMLVTAAVALRRGRRLVGLCLLAFSVSMAIISYVLPTMMEPQMAMIPWSLCALAVSSTGGVASRESAKTVT